jgi:DNA protecting protein DprA
MARTRSKNQSTPVEPTVPLDGSVSAELLAGLLAAGAPPRFLRRLLCRYRSVEDWYRCDLLEGEDPAWRHVGPVKLRCDDAVVWGSSRYPAALASIPTPPPVLFVDGSLAALTSGVSVVGARSMTDLGRTVATLAATTAVSLGAPVISGLARGVDIAAHTAALDAGGVCVAFHGGGLTVMSAEQRQVRDRIVAGGGAVCSEVPFEMTPSPGSLMARNRLIAACAAPLVVAEAAARSGTTACAGDAVMLGRPLVVPRPKVGFRRMSTAQGLAALAGPGQEGARRLGWSQAALTKIMHLDPIANAVCDTRDDLVTAISVFWWLHRPDVEQVAPAA